MNSYAYWFRRFVVLGILVNLFFAIPGSFIPNAVMGIVGVPPTLDPIWPAFASWLLLLLSLFYIPAASDPFKYRTIAWLAVFARVAGVIFFFGIWQMYPLFGFIDLFFAAAQGITLILALREGPDYEA